MQGVPFRGSLLLQRCTPDIRDKLTWFNPLLSLPELADVRLSIYLTDVLLHLQDLADRYGKPLIVLNLVKGAEKRPRESILQSEFANAIAYINKGVSHSPFHGHGPSLMNCLTGVA